MAWAMPGCLWVLFSASASPTANYPAGAEEGSNVCRVRKTHSTLLSTLSSLFLISLISLSLISLSLISLSHLSLSYLSLSSLFHISLSLSLISLSLSLFSFSFFSLSPSLSLFSHVVFLSPSCSSSLPFYLYPFCSTSLPLCITLLIHGSVVSMRIHSNIIT